MKLYANPYDMSATGFFFETGEEFQEKYDAAYKARGTEEYEIEAIDGEEWELALFRAASISQANVLAFLEWIDEMDSEPDSVKAGAWHRMENLGDSFEDVKDKRYLDECILHVCGNGVYSEEEALEEYAEHITEECGGPIPENLKYYIDYKKMGLDMRLSGDVDAEEFDGRWFIFSYH